MKIRSRPARSDAGFTMLELLVSSVVLVMVLGIMLATLTTSLGLWRGTENRVSADREARAAELLMKQDLDSVVMTTNPNLWPRLDGNSLQFVTAKSEDYESSGVGDVFFVEYTFLPDPRGAAGQILVRRSLGRADTYAQIIQAKGFPSPKTDQIGESDPGCPQLLATNLIAVMTNVVRGAKIEKDGELSQENVVILGPDMTKLTGAYTAANYPTAIEVNFAAANPDAIKNADLLDISTYKLRDAGLYSFRVNLQPPRPQQLP